MTLTPKNHTIHLASIDVKAGTLMPITVGPVVKGTQDATHIKIWSKIKPIKKPKKTNTVTYVLARIKELGSSNYDLDNYRYAIPSKEHRYITTVDYDDLRDNSLYEYQIGSITIKNNNLNQHYEIEEIYVHADWSYSSYGTFKTTSSDGTSFIFGSCRKWISVCGIELFGLGKSADKVYGAIRSHSIDFFLGVGDQVYLDPCGNNILQCKSFKSIIKRYDTVRSYENIRSLMANTTVYEICDDHDHMCNNSNYKTRHRQKRLYRNAMRAYTYYQSLEGPSMNSDNLTDSNENNKIKKPLYYSFDRNNSSFFVMDTRDERDETSSINKKIISKRQFDEINDWLKFHASMNKTLFLVSPTPVLSVMSQDSWYGYPRQQAKLIKMILDSGIKNIYILTGDCHCCRVGVYQVIDDGWQNDQENDINIEMSSQDSSDSGSKKYITEIMSSGLASLNHHYGKEFKSKTNFNIDTYNRHNDFPYSIDNRNNTGVKLITKFATPTYPRPEDKLSTGVFVKITVKENMTVEVFNQKNNLLDTCIFNLFD